MKLLLGFSTDEVINFKTQPLPKFSASYGPSREHLTLLGTFHTQTIILTKARILRDSHSLMNKCDWTKVWQTGTVDSLSVC